MWTAQDDFLAPEFIEECLAVLMGEPTEAGCAAGVQIQDSRGVPIGTVAPPPAFSSRDPVRRVRGLFRGFHALPIYSLFRLDTLPPESDSLFRDAHGWDRVFLFNILLRGPIMSAKRVLLFKRSIEREYKFQGRDQHLWLGSHDAAVRVSGTV